MSGPGRPGVAPRSPLERLLERCAETAGPMDDPCWVFTGGLHSAGYAVVGYSPSPGRQVRLYGHRVTFMHFVGDIPSGLHLDHLCRNRACVNPWHVEPVLPGVNVLRGESASGNNARKSACVRGHKFTERNTYITTSGHRRCRSCAAEYQRRLRAKRKDAAA